MQQITWPSQSVTATNPSVAPNGQSPSAAQSTLVAGQNPGGDQQALQTDASGNLLVNLASPSSPLAVSISSPIGSQVIASSVAVAIASNQVVPVSATSLPLPAGAATEATLATRATEATLATRASEATLATRASESTLATRATEATLSSQAAVLSSRLSGSLVPAAYDEIQLTYTGSNVTTVVYKLAAATVKTLTLSYTGSQLDSVVAS